MQQLIVSSKHESLKEIEHFLEHVVVEHNVSDEVFGNMLIGVTEAVNNAIIHGNKEDGSKKVVLEFEREESPDKLVFHIHDEGDGFDYNGLPDPTHPDNLMVVGGRGVFLFKQLADWVVFRNEGATIELQFRL